MWQGKKILFISFVGEQQYTGGGLCSKRNLLSLEKIFGKENIDVFYITPYFGKGTLLGVINRIINIFRGYLGGLDRKKTNNIISVISKNKYTDIYFDSSLLGCLIKQINSKFKDVKLYTFFHNCEYKFYKSLISANNEYTRLYWLVLSYLNEKLSCLYSNKIIALNERDAKDIYGLYRRKPDFLIPITLKAAYSILEDTKNIINEKRNALFVGSYFYGNIEGLRWFCKEVLPKVDITLTIVGSDMDKFQKEISDSKKINIYSNVPDLSPYYENADFMILPILSGSGMKVKTAEALMYGKYIIGTDEALLGYQVDNDIASICNSKEEFINAISNIDIKYKYNEHSRVLFDKLYSFESSVELFDQIFRD